MHLTRHMGDTEVIDSTTHEFLRSKPNNTNNITSSSSTTTIATITIAKESMTSDLRAKTTNISAVYRWYEVEDGFSAKKREESSIAKCQLCTEQGKVDHKTYVRFSKSVTSNLWRHLKENHPDVYEKHAGEKKSVQMHRMNVRKRGRKRKKREKSFQSQKTKVMCFH